MRAARPSLLCVVLFAAPCLSETVQARVPTAGDTARAVLLRAESLGREGRRDEARELLREFLDRDEDVPARDIRERVKIELGRLIDASARELTASTRDALDSGDPRQAVQRASELVTLRASSPFLADGGRGQRTGSPAEFIHRVELKLFRDAVALEAYARWRSGDLSSLEAVLARELPGIAAQVPERRLLLSAHVAEFAAGLFADRRWAESATAYGFSRSQRLTALGGTFDEEVGRQQYNQAMAEYNARRFKNARQLLHQLQRELPGYRTEVVAGDLIDVDQALGLAGTTAAD